MNNRQLLVALRASRNPSRTPDGDSPGDVFSAVVKLYEDDREIEVHWS